MSNYHDGERHGVVRYPDGYAVIDKQNLNQVVYTTSNRALAHRECSKLNRRETKT